MLFGSMSYSLHLKGFYTFKLLTTMALFFRPCRGIDIYHITTHPYHIPSSSQLSPFCTTPIIQPSIIMVDTPMVHVFYPSYVHPLTYPLIQPYIHLSVHSFNRLSLTHSSTHSTIHPPTQPSFHPFNHLSTHSTIYPPTHSLNFPSTHPNIHVCYQSSVYPLTYPHIHPPTHSSTHPSVIHSTTQPSIHSFNHLFPSSIHRSFH